MEFKELSWISGKPFLWFRNNLLLSSGLYSTKKGNFLVSFTEWEKDNSNKQEAWKFITKTSKTEVGNDVKLSVI